MSEQTEMHITLRRKKSTLWIFVLPAFLMTLIWTKLDFQHYNTHTHTHTHAQHTHIATVTHSLKTHANQNITNTTLANLRGSNLQQRKSNHLHTTRRKSDATDMQENLLHNKRKMLNKTRNKKQTASSKEKVHAKQVEKLAGNMHPWPKLGKRHAGV